MMNVAGPISAAAEIPDPPRSSIVPAVAAAAAIELL
jgi:hypothetical protein